MVRWNIAAVVGVPGVGKTSLCKSAAMARGYSYVNYGDLMLGEALSQNLASNKDEMFKLGLEDQHSIWKAAALKVKELTVDNILLDLHGVDRSPSGYIISLPIEFINPDIIILVESSYDNIIHRRKDDKSRNRPLESKETVNEYMNFLRITMVNCSIICGSYLKVLENDDLEGCLNELEYIIG